MNKSDPSGHACGPCAAVFEFGISVFDIHDAVSTVNDPHATTTDKSITVIGASVGVALPGGGFGYFGRKGFQAAKNFYGKVNVRAGYGQININKAKSNRSYNQSLQNKASTKTRTQKVVPVRKATGPHTTWKKDPTTGKITRHETWTPNPRNPKQWDSKQSTDLYGRSHRNKKTGELVSTPHTQGKNIPGGVRPATRGETPRDFGTKSNVNKSE